MILPNVIDTGKKGYDFHIQGIAVDTERGFVYCSFTTQLVKMNLSGKIIGSVSGITGHLGCITLDRESGRVIGTVEYKHDGIGKGIMKKTGKVISSDGFYLVSFDTEKITSENMDAERDGIMKAVWLKEPLDYYIGIDPVSNKSHVYGASGIDGVAIGPSFGSGRDSEKRIMVSVCMYGDNERCDNDNQIILEYRMSIFDLYGATLSQLEPHTQGPEKAEGVYFLHTGNTCYGVQNLEYIEEKGTWLLCVYPGSKAEYENFSCFFLDGDAKPIPGKVKGRGGETGMILSFKRMGQSRDGVIFGSHFPYGSTGVSYVGHGLIYFSVDRKTSEGYHSSITLYRLTDTDQVFMPIFDCCVL